LSGLSTLRWSKNPSGSSKNCVLLISQV
jgi:hypothetical protein